MRELDANALRFFVVLVLVRLMYIFLFHFVAALGFIIKKVPFDIMFLLTGILNLMALNLNILCSNNNFNLIQFKKKEFQFCFFLSYI